MILSAPNPVAFEVFGVGIYWYGVIFALAILAGTFVADFVYRKYFFVEDQKDLIFDLVPILILIGFLGARLYYCIVNWEYYSFHLSEVFNTRQGGLSIHGTLFASVFFLIFWTKFKNLPFFQITSPLCLGLALGQIIGRWGNFFNSEAFGKPYDGFWKLYISPEFRPEIYLQYEFFHPTFLYESLLSCMIFLVLFCLVKNKVCSKIIVGVYFLLYSIARIFVENLRIDSVLSVWGIPIAIIVSALLAVVGVILILLALKEKFR